MKRNIFAEPTSVPHVFVGPLSPGAESKDYLAHRHFGNRKQTLESPKISTRRHQTPNKRIGKLNCKSYTHEVLKKFRIWETLNLLTYADRSSNTIFFFGGGAIKKIF